jgi:hypothetical protein
MTDNPKVKASKAIDDARVASHAGIDDAKVAAHNAFKEAKVAAYTERDEAAESKKVSDKFNISTHKDDANVQIAAHEAKSKLNLK